ncbi:MAG: dynamin family protein [Pseudomonadota bacterium]
MSSNPFDEYLQPIKTTTQDIEDIREARTDLSSALHRLEGAVVPEDVTTVEELMDAFEGFAAKVALIGQVKAGKTALVNALIGTSDLLPSDVNPWTSVVTSMHVNCIAPKGKNAIFKFFDNKDWDDLVSDSGRIVKLAKKAKLDSRLDELTQQIQELRDRTEGRLGRNFKMLLGNQHSFSSYSSDLIKRYVCLGEEEAILEKEGRFADLTKSADLYIESEHFDYPLTIADTPGVNDPFLVREAATLENLGKSDVCVVVLSAHQALSSVDLGLMRLLKSLRSKRLIAFVNRIDELPDPHNQIEEIRAYIAEVLRKQNLSEEIPIIFGSAAWADAAVTGSFENLPEDSVDSLASLVEARATALEPGAHDAENINNLSDVSGISALRAAINEKVWQEVYRPKIAFDANRARRLAERSVLYLSEVRKDERLEIDPVAIGQAMSSLHTGQKAIAKAMNDYREKAKQQVKHGIAAAYHDFNYQEERNLNACLSGRGKVKDWVPNTESLRTQLNAAYDTYSEDTVTFLRRLSDKIVANVSKAYSLALNSNEIPRITPQPVPEPPIPLSLMRTMSVDLRARGSMDWLRRKLDKSVYLEQFREISNDDLHTTISETCDDVVETYLVKITTDLLSFLEEHKTTIESFGKLNDAALSESLSGTDGELAERIRSLRDSSDILFALEGADLEDVIDQPSVEEMAV